MTLKDYLHQNKLTVREFADKLGIRYESICRYLRGHNASLKCAYKIATETKELVTVQELRKDNGKKV